jgi:hypothetical protein
MNTTTDNKTKKKDYTNVKEFFANVAAVYIITIIIAGFILFIYKINTDPVPERSKTNNERRVSRPPGWFTY